MPADLVFLFLFDRAGTRAELDTRPRRPRIVGDRRKECLCQRQGSSVGQVGGGNLQPRAARANGTRYPAVVGPGTSQRPDPPEAS